MRPRVQRHLPDLFEAAHLGRHQTTAAPTSAAATQQGSVPEKPDELSWRDYVVMLLHLGAEIEHGLMVQYLYGAYSLGGDQVPPEHRQTVRRWRSSMLAIAKEEMGHLLSVQNVARLLGGPISFDREDFPWDTPFFPFPFKLEPLTLDSLACYVFAEMPPRSAVQPAPSASGQQAGRALAARYGRLSHEEREKIRDAVYARMGGEKPHHVGKLYTRILEVISDPSRIPDSLLQADTFGLQASWDDWGRGYRAGSATQDAAPPQHAPAPSDREADVIIARMATRTEAIAALRDIASQGEAPHLRGDDRDEPSHFDRFAEIYQGFEKIGSWRPACEVAVNPTTVDPGRASTGCTMIEWKPSAHWAHLFNLRYRMLLTYLAHTYRLARGSDAEKPSARGATMHRVFAEMYNLKTIAGILMRLPLKDPADPRRAGPPFQMPYTLTLPQTEGDCWRLHQDLLGASQDLCKKLFVDAVPGAESYLKALRDLDQQSMAWTEQILAGLGSTRRHYA